MQNIVLPADEKRTYLMAIEGNIGVGKTTFGKVLQKALESNGIPTLFICEPIENWRNIGLLERMYTEETAGYECQTMFFATRLIHIVKEMKKNTDARVVIVDRSWITDRLFIQNLADMKLSNGEPKVSSLQMSWYAIWAGFWIDQLQLPLNHAIYLRCNPTVAEKRINARKRSEEKTIGLDYLEGLHRLHDEQLLTEPKCHVIPYDEFDISNAKLLEDSIQPILLDIKNFFGNSNQVAQ